jgi:hypothetical protein
MIILALDLGKFNTMGCIYNSKTRKHEFIDATTERTYLTTLLKKTKCDLVVVKAKEGHSMFSEGMEGATHARRAERWSSRKPKVSAAFSVLLFGAEDLPG